MYADKHSAQRSSAGVGLRGTKFEPSEMADSRRRAEAITKLKILIAKWGLTYEQLHDAGCFGAKSERRAKPVTTLYRNALGQTWDGQGEMPDWLVRAVSSGQSLEFYRA